MKSVSLRSFLLVLFALAALAASADSHAQSSQHVMEQLLVAFDGSKGGWLAEIRGFAIWFFWSMAGIGLVWSFAVLLFGKADIGLFIGSLVRFMVLVSVFWWLLDAGAGESGMIMGFEESIRKLAGRMTGGAALAPDNMILPGLRIMHDVINSAGDVSENHFSLSSSMAIITVVALTLAAINIVLLTVALWVLAFAGIFLLGFGGAGWSSDIAVNYFKYVGSVVFSLLVLRIIGAVAAAVLDAQYAATAGTAFTLPNQVLMMVMAIAVAVLMTRLPGLLAGIVQGARVGPGQSAFMLSTQAASVAGSALAAGGRHLASNAQSMYETHGRSSAGTLHSVHEAAARTHGWSAEDRTLFDTQVQARDPSPPRSESVVMPASRDGADHGAQPRAQRSEGSPEESRIGPAEAMKDNQRAPSAMPAAPRADATAQNTKEHSRAAGAMADPQHASERFGVALGSDVRPPVGSEPASTAVDSGLQADVPSPTDVKGPHAGPRQDGPLPPVRMTPDAERAHNVHEAAASAERGQSAGAAAPGQRDAAAPDAVHSLPVTERQAHAVPSATRDVASAEADTAAQRGAPSPTATVGPHDGSRQDVLPPVAATPDAVTAHTVHEAVPSAEAEAGQAADAAARTRRNAAEPDPAHPAPLPAGQAHAAPMPKHEERSVVPAAAVRESDTAPAQRLPTPAPAGKGSTPSTEQSTTRPIQSGNSDGQTSPQSQGEARTRGVVEHPADRAITPLSAEQKNSAAARVDHRSSAGPQGAADRAPAPRGAEGAVRPAAAPPAPGAAADGRKQDANRRLLGEVLSEEDSQRARKRNAERAANRRAASGKPEKPKLSVRSDVDAAQEIKQFREGSEQEEQP